MPLPSCPTTLLTTALFLSSTAHALATHTRHEARAPATSTAAQKVSQTRNAPSATGTGNGNGNGKKAKKSTLSTGAIVGIVIAIIFTIAVLLTATALLIRRRRQRAQSRPNIIGRMPSWTATSPPQEAGEIMHGGLDDRLQNPGTPGVIEKIRGSVGVSPKPGQGVGLNGMEGGVGVNGTPKIGIDMEKKKAELSALSPETKPEMDASRERVEMPATPVRTPPMAGAAVGSGESVKELEATRPVAQLTSGIGTATQTGDLHL